MFRRFGNVTGDSPAALHIENFEQQHRKHGRIVLTQLGRPRLSQYSFKSPFRYKTQAFIHIAVPARMLRCLSRAGSHSAPSCRRVGYKPAAKAEAHQCTNDRIAYRLHQAWQPHRQPKHFLKTTLKCRMPVNMLTNQTPSTESVWL